MKRAGRSILAWATIAAIAYLLPEAITSRSPVTALAGADYSSSTGASPGGPSDATVSQPAALGIARYPRCAPFNGQVMDALPRFNPNEEDIWWRMDLRNRDLTRLDLRGRAGDLKHAVFDVSTKWPASLPRGFNPGKMMVLGKDPGLGIRDLHDKGITGKGVGIALIDGGFLVDHEEYGNRVVHYEETREYTDPDLMMHGGMCASLIAGQTTGVAPEVDLYLFALAPENGQFRPTEVAASIEKVIALNRSLPPERKVRAISLSLGWSFTEEWKVAEEAAQHAKSEGIFMISTNLPGMYKIAIGGLGRDPLADPGRPRSYRPCDWFEPLFYSGLLTMGFSRSGAREVLWIPIDDRCVAGPAAVDDFFYYHAGAGSNMPPYLAGLYALACQVKPEVTSKEFWETALLTGYSIEVKPGLRTYKLSKIVNPAGLVEALQGRK